LNAGEGGAATDSFLREIVVARGLVGWPQEGHGGDKAWLRRFVAVVCPGWRCENNGAVTVKQRAVSFYFWCNNAVTTL
jgi:hypothetical protein